MPPLIHDLPAERLALIQLFAMDCDGVLTDGRVWLDDQGHQSKAFSVVDGYGLTLLRDRGVTLALITRDPSPIPPLRARRLGFHHSFGDVQDKKACLLALAASLNLPPEAIAYMGDDLPDLPAFEAAGLRIAPPGSRAAVLRAAHATTGAQAGFGAVREVCDALLDARPQP
jgi:3-deoxy-D-manno-octulosonate 8-phosphate phosphatase (KDO 8-P phosphatase)